MTPTRTQSLPKLKGVPQEAADEIRRIASMNQRLEARITQLESSGFITSQQADAKYSAPVIAQQLSASGASPLNVVNVGGKNILLAQPGKGGK